MVAIFNWDENKLTIARHCPLCGSKDSHFLVTRGDGLPIYECSTCLFAFLYKRPEYRELEKYYNSGYFQNSNTYQDYFNYAKAIIELNYCPRLHRLSQFIPDFHKKRVLDVGCAAGGSLALLKKMGAEISGIELSETACKIAKEYFNLDLIHAPIEKISFKEESFDIIFLFDVLEHLEEPSKILERLISSLAPEGFLSVTVPNFDLFFYEKEKWIGISSYWEHLGYFRSKVLCNKLSSLGLKVVETHTYGNSNLQQHLKKIKIGKIKRKLRERYNIYGKIFRILSRTKFKLLGRPSLDIRYDGSGMDIFVLAKKL